MYTLQLKLVFELDSSVVDLPCLRPLVQSFSNSPSSVFRKDCAKNQASGYRCLLPLWKRKNPGTELTKMSAVLCLPSRTKSISLREDMFESQTMGHLWGSIIHLKMLEKTYLKPTGRAPTGTPPRPSSRLSSPPRHALFLQAPPIQAGTLFRPRPPHS